MPRGQVSTIGSTNTSVNGYHYTRTHDGWRLTHHLIAERARGGKKINTSEETVRFKDGDKTNLDPSNIEVVSRKPKSVQARLAKLYAKKAEIEAEIKELEAQEFKLA